MSDIKVNRERSQLKMRKCRCCHRLDYSRLECKTKEEITMDGNKNGNSIEEKPKMAVKLN